MLTKTVLYNPQIFDIEDIDQAKEIILTQEQGTPSSNWRWENETPYLINQILNAVPLSKNSIVLDYGCGVGRLAKGLIDRTGCIVVGADISANMRGLACSYVESPRFMVCHPSLLDEFVAHVDLVLAVWVLQHCAKLEESIGEMIEPMAPNAKLFLVNQQYRAVPVREEPYWANDGKDVFECLEEAGLRLLSNTKMDQARVGGVAEIATMKLYQR